MIHHFDHRYATYQPDGSIRDTTLEEHQDPSFAPMPRYWVEEGQVEQKLVKRDRDGNVVWRWEQPWLLGLRKTARSTDVRTAISALFPLSAVNDKLPLVVFEEQQADLALLFTAIYSSLPLDYVLRQSVGGTDVGHFVLAQLPFPRPNDIPNEIRARVVTLSRQLVLSDGVMMTALPSSSRTATWDTQSRSTSQYELDALCFHLFGLGDNDAAYVMNTFEVLRRRELDEYGYFRTKEAVAATAANLK